MTNQMLLKTHEVAELLAVSPATIKAWRLGVRKPPSGTELHFVCLGRAIRYRVEDVKDFVAQLTDAARRQTDGGERSENGKARSFI